MVILAAVSTEPISSNVAPVGEHLADAFDEELVVLHVMPEDRFDELQELWNEEDLPPDIRADMAAADMGIVDAYPGMPDDREPEGYYLDDAVADASAIAEEVATQSLDDPAGVRSRGRVGDPVAEILSEAEKLDARYVVVGGRKRTAVGKAIFGSTTQSILLRTETPVVTVPGDVSEPTGGNRPVVAAVDRSERAPRTVREARILADALGRDLHVVHVLSGDAFDDLGRSETAGDDGGRQERIEATAATIARETAETTVEDFEAVGLVGDPSQQVVAYGAKQDASYIVTSGRKRSPVGKVVFGSVTQSILLNADRPVLSIMSES